MSEIVRNGAAGALSAEGTTARAPARRKRARRQPVYLLVIRVLSVLLVLSLWYLSTERG
ncbi:MAG: hypothetical protein JO000_16550, partial [Alphaproteobacteria bacterium]|nr:hypothetical protein [Alphaproteobacteria bacterium]